MRQLLEDLGLSSADRGAEVDLVVVNTCCVTRTASAKSRAYIQRAKRQNPAARVVVCGCMPIAAAAELGNFGGNGVCVVKQREALAAVLGQMAAEVKPESEEKPSQVDDSTILCNSLELPQLRAFKGHTRAFLKVQDGCRRSCSYCVIPIARGDVQSRPNHEAVAEAQALVAAGHKEIVVTGVCLGEYGAGQQILEQRKTLCDGEPLAELVHRLAQVEGLRRLRVSSVDPDDVTDGLLDVFARYENIMPHFHLSVQSGSDAVLRRMGRQYSADVVRERIGAIKGRLDRPAITADFIVGFPGETETDFEATCELARWAGFSKMHVFPFSPREGTAATKMKNKVDSKTIRRRAETLRRLSDDLGREFREQFIGQTCNVLIESDGGVEVSGRCERYFMVSLTTKPRSHEETVTTDSTDLIAEKRHKKAQNNLVPWSLCGKGEIVKVKIEEVTAEGVFGTTDSFHH